jgi:hypothetical protein
MLAAGFNSSERNFEDDMKRFFKLFTESMLEGSKVAARKMKKIVNRQTKHNQSVFLFHGLDILVRADPEKLLWSTSPLIVLLQFVDSNVLLGDEGETRCTFLHKLVLLADASSSDYSNEESQLTLGRQLIEHGANVNAVAYPGGETPLHLACNAATATNLDFIELLLENGADPNAQEHSRGLTPLMGTTMFAPGAAKFLLEWATTDVNITDSSGASFRAWVREAVDYFSDQVELPDNPDRVKDQFVLQEWCEVEELLIFKVVFQGGNSYL